MLSLRESASLLRKGQVLQRGRRAASMSGQESEHASTRASIAAGTLQAESAMATAGTRRQMQQTGLQQLSQGTKRLAALRRQRRSQWLSDFSSGSPGWSTSQVGPLRPYSLKSSACGFFYAA
jgi:hypothetical protein